MEKSVANTSFSQKQMDHMKEKVGKEFLSLIEFDVAARWVIDQ